jgi:hypothetical protein
MVESGHCIEFLTRQNEALAPCANLHWSFSDHSIPGITSLVSFVSTGSFFGSLTRHFASLLAPLKSIKNNY